MLCRTEWETKRCDSHGQNVTCRGHVREQVSGMANKACGGDRREKHMKDCKGRRPGACQAVGVKRQARWWEDSGISVKDGGERLGPARRSVKSGR